MESFSRNGYTVTRLPWMSDDFWENEKQRVGKDYGYKDGSLYGERNGQS